MMQFHLAIGHLARMPLHSCAAGLPNRVNVGGVLMGCYLKCLAVGCMTTALLAVGVVAQGEVNPETAIVQNSGPVDRAAGNGSMGAGEGIDYLDEKSEQSTDRPRQKYEPADSSEAELRHGGNETDMEHKHRPTLGDERD